MQSWAPDTFFTIRYPIFRYFEACIRYRYSDTFPNFAVRYPIFDNDTFFNKTPSCAHIAGRIDPGLPLHLYSKCWGSTLGDPGSKRPAMWALARQNTVQGY
jgi:hypothetical protein